MDYTPRCSCGVQVDRYLYDGLSRRVFGSFLTARMRVKCSGTGQVGRVRVFEELPTVCNCSVLTFWSARKFHRE
jgi:hypothetical protein